MKIQTNRLIIRSFSESDINTYCKIVSKPEVVKYLRNNKPHSKIEAESYIKDTMSKEKSSGIARYAVSLKTTGELIGFCGFDISGNNIDFGWRYDSSVWGNGYASEAAHAVLNFGINELKLNSIIAGCAIENIASVKIIEKLGFPHCESGIVNGRKTIKYSQHASNKSL